MAFPPRKIFLFLSLLLLIGSGFAALTKSESASKSVQASRKSNSDKTHLNLVRHDDGEIIFEWDCPDITLERIGNDGPISGISMSGTASSFKIGVPCLPQLSQILDCLPGRVDAQIAEIDADTRQLGEMAPTPEDVMVDPPPSDDGRMDRNPLDSGAPPPTLEELRSMTPLTEGLWPSQQLRVVEAGVYRGHRLVNIVFYPVQVDARAGIARVTRHVRIRVTMPRNDTAVNRLPDRSDETAILRSMLGPLAPTVQPSRMTESFEGHGADQRPLDETIGGRWRIIVNQEGITRLTAEDLRFVGCPVEQISTFDTHISNRGREIPIYFSGEADGHFDDNDFIDFYAIPNRQTFSSQTPSLYQDFWTAENVYFLSWGDARSGLRLGNEDGSWKTGPLWGPNRVHNQSNVRVTVHAERDTKFDRLSESTGRWTTQMRANGPLSVYEDHWFWDDRVDALNTRDYPVTLPYPDTRSLQRKVAVRAALQGFSGAVGIPDADQHRVVVSLDNVTAPGLSAGKVTQGDGNPAWQGQTPMIVQTLPYDSIGISNTDLRASNNLATLTVTGDGLAGTYDKVYANWFEIDYDRELRARDHFLSFRFDTTRGDTFSWDIRGFSSLSISVWKIGEARLTGLETREVAPAEEGPSAAVRFQLISDGAYDIVVFDNAYPHPPLAIEPELGTRDVREQVGAEYLMIYHDQFANEPALLRLDSLRRVTFNGSVDTIRVSEIYDQFSDGITTPLAIHRFLKYAYEHWTIRPTHVCLIGDGIADTRNLNQSGNLISSFYVPTADYGIASADFLFGCVSGPPADVIPDIAVGRISCRSVSELESYVEKLVRYETPEDVDYSSPYHSRILFVSDRRDNNFVFDRGFSEQVVNLVPDYVNISRVYLDSLNAGQGPAVLRDAFRDGSIIVNYNGHGGGGQWSGSALMDVGKVRLLNNARDYPFITNFTCYVGAFDVRNQADVLGEAFLFSRNNRLDPVGGIAVYSSTSVGWAYTGVTMQKRLFDFIAEPPGLTVGQIVQSNKIRFWPGVEYLNATRPEFSMMMTMTLLGDPGVRLKLPQRMWNDFAADKTIVSPGDTIFVSGDLPWDPQGAVTDVYALLYNDRFRTTEIEQVFNGVNYFTDTLHTDRNNTPAFNASLIIPTPVRTQHFDSIMVRIPAQTSRSLVAASGHVVLYAADPGGADILPRDAVGSFPVYNADSLNQLRLFNVSVIPASYIQNDTVFQVEATLSHSSGIQSVQARGSFRPAQGPVVIDTVAMTEIIPGHWRTPDLGPYSVFGGSYRIGFTARLGNGQTQTTDDFTLGLELRPDFGIYQLNPIVPAQHPDTQPYYVISVANDVATRSRPVPALPIRLIGVHDSTYYDSSLHHQVTIPADSFASNIIVPNPADQPSLFEAKVPALLRPGNYRVRILLDPDSIITESNENNNLYSTTLVTTPLLPASNSLGSYLPRFSPQTTAPHRFWTSGVTDTLRALLFPGSLPIDSTTLIYSTSTLSAAEISRLSTAGFFAPVTGQTVRTFHITLGDSTELLTSDGRVRVAKNFSGMTDSASALNLSLFVKLRNSNAWWKLRSQAFEYMRRDTTYPPGGGTQIRWSGRISGEANSLGTFAVFRYSDTRGPDITFTAGGLQFTRHSILPRYPEIYANLSDLSGIDRSPGKFYFVMDGDTIPESSITWSDSSAWGGNISALIRPNLAPGVHVIWVKATDNIGNTDSLSADFEIRGKFGIEWAINFPNPFQKNTTIAYLLTDVTDQFVEVKIFTVSGRHIRTLYETERAAANYRAIVWNGRDYQNEEVANGVYFARIRAKQGDQEVEKIIKLAKVR